MATLQTTQRGSAFIAKSRLGQTSRTTKTPVNTRPTETVVTRIANRPAALTTDQAFPAQLGELDQHKLLLQIAANYREWRLVSIQNQSERGVVTAWLVHSRDTQDPTLLIQQGQAMQIIIDAVGDTHIHQPQRAPQVGGWRRWWHKIAQFTHR